MAFKETKRKAFNFLRSYFDVLNELKTDSDKLEFLLSIINKQFLDEDPKDLEFLVNLCYESQRHAIESSVKGWKRVSKTDMKGNPLTNPSTLVGTNPPTNPPTNPMTNPKEVEVEVEGEVKEESITPKGVLVIWDKIKKSYNPRSKETSLTDSRRKSIGARIKEGNGADQFEGTIKYMFSKWYTDVNMNGYLTPETILGTKFTKYLEEARENKNKKQPHEIGKGSGGFSMMEYYEQNKPQ